jgi:hypothetical protein
MIAAAAETPLLAPLMASALVTAFLHAALPTHWLPFVLVGRAQGWRLITVMMAVVVAGLAHVATTALVGGVIAGLGVALDQWIGGLLPVLAAVVLFVLGGRYLLRAWQQPSTDGAAADQTVRRRIGDRTAFWGLVMTLAITPGEVMLPFYLSQANAGWPILAGLTVMFALGTVSGMAVFTLLAWTGWSVLRLERWARYESIALGAALIAVGLFVLFWRH